MQAENHIAFKEWAIVCEALARGRQSLILRKGGIHEGREGFRIEHRAFWLFPTRFHQKPGDIVEEAEPLWQQVFEHQPPQGTIRIQHYAVVEEVFPIEEETRLPALNGLHIWSEETVHQRFHYRRPGLFALLVRISGREQPFELPDLKRYAGCRSWVDLDRKLPTGPLKPVLEEAEANRQWSEIRRVLN